MIDQEPLSAPSAQELPQEPLQEISTSSQKGSPTLNEEQLEKVMGTGAGPSKVLSLPMLLRTPSGRVARTSDDATRALTALAQRLRGSHRSGELLQAVPRTDGTYHILISKEVQDGVSNVVKVMP